jgi:DNA-binding NarL/FixJ family response regulator
LLTGYATVELAVSALTRHHASTCLRKEAFNRGEFFELVERILASLPPSDADEKSAGGESPEDLKDRQGLPREKDPAGVEKGPILVVEDDAGWQSILTEILVDAGYRVRQCGSFGEALGCLRRERYILAVVDLSLDGPFHFTSKPWEEGEGPAGQNLDGYRLLASTRAGGVPTVVVSGVLNVDGIERAYTDQGIFAFLQKQAFNRQTFLQTIQEALAASQPNQAFTALTDREREVLELLARGLTNKEIAEALVISTNTVKRHLKAIFDKLDVHTRSAAAAKALSGGGQDL